MPNKKAYNKVGNLAQKAAKAGMKAYPKKGGKKNDMFGKAMKAGKKVPMPKRKKRR